MPRVLVITAVAGSGKTRRVVDRVVDILLHGGVATVAVLANSVRNEITERILRWAGGEGRRVDHNGAVLEWEGGEWRQVGTSRSGGGGGSHDYLRVVGLPGLVHVASLDGLVHLALSRMSDEVTAEGQILFGERRTAEGEPREAEAIDGTDYRGKKRLMRRLLGEDPRNVALAVDAIFPPAEGGPRRIGLFLDEFQDVEDEVVEVAAALALEVARRGAGNLTMVVGDPRQNVFGKTERSLLDFSERVEEGAEGEGWFEAERMSVCHRCPQGHLALVNHLYPAPEHQRMDHPLEAAQTEEEAGRAREASRPVLVGVDTMDRRAAAAAMARELVERFEEMSSRDGGRMRLDDVAVLSPQINNNPLLSCLEDELNRRLRGYAPPGQAAVKLFRTGEASTSIKWDEAKGRVAMLTVHADKGMTHRLCLFCSATEGVLPRKGVGSEVQYTSQLYVGLTRSSEVLLVAVGVGNRELGCSTLFPRSTVNEWVISRYFRRRFARPGDMLALCRWSRHSVCRVGEVVWFPPERYAPIRAEDKRQQEEEEGPVTTVTQWANRVAPGELVEGAPRTPLRFAPNLTHHPGMLSVRRASFEFAIGRLAEQRLQAAFRGQAGGRGVRVALAGSKRAGWLEAARFWGERGEADVAGAIDWACRFCGEGAEALAPDLSLRGRQLWCLALVDLANIGDDPSADDRPAALTAAAHLFAGDGSQTGIDEAALDLAVKMDVNASATARWLRDHLEGELGAGALASALFEQDCRVIHPKPMLGRMDLYLPRAQAVVEIKTTTIETGADEAPDPGWMPRLCTLAEGRARWAAGDGGLPQRASHLAVGLMPKRPPPPGGREGEEEPPSKRARRLAREIPEEQPSRGAMSQALLYAGMMGRGGVTRSIVIDVSRGAHWEHRFTEQERARILHRATEGR